jgi:hypothetical protein
MIALWIIPVLGLTASAVWALSRLRKRNRKYGAFASFQPALRECSNGSAVPMLGDVHPMVAEPAYETDIDCAYAGAFSTPESSELQPSEPTSRQGGSKKLADIPLTMLQSSVLQFADALITDVGSAKQLSTPPNTNPTQEVAVSVPDTGSKSGSSAGSASASEESRPSRNSPPKVPPGTRAQTKTRSQSTGSSPERKRDANSSTVSSGHDTSRPNTNNGYDVELNSQTQLLGSITGAESFAEEVEQVATESEITRRVPTYRPLAPIAPTVSTRSKRIASTRPTQSTTSDLRLRVQLVFGRGGIVRNVALVPDYRDGMPSEIAVTGTQGALYLTELTDDCYEPVTPADAGNALHQGIDWRSDGGRWRWVMGGRELYVLAPGDEFGLNGFVSTPRLLLNTRHVVLATLRLRGEVLSALESAGCSTPTISDDTTPGIPAGWLLFRDVVPTQFVLREEGDFLNALCPAHEIEPHFIGGIRLERNRWLIGYPPRIRFSGELPDSFHVKIDGQTAQQATDGAFEALGWDSEGEHRLWFGDQSETYSLCMIEDGWKQWHAHDFGTGVAICGASVCQLDATRRIQVRIPASNPVLVGARPGEVFYCYVRHDLRCESVLAVVPFVPVWALPANPIHANKQSAYIMLCDPSEPEQIDIRTLTGCRETRRSLVTWIGIISEANSKGLRLVSNDEHARVLWRHYRDLAKQLKRRMR